MIKSIVFILLICVGFSMPSQAPVIGIYTQIDQYDQPSSSQYLSTYISAAYVKFVWMSGAQVVPIYAFSQQSDIQAILKKVNGVLFTGGAGQDQIHISNRWVKNANFILQWAIKENKNGNVFPIWGTCLGLQLLTYLTSRFDQSILQPIRGSDHYLNTLVFQQKSSLYDDLDQNLKEKLTKVGILYFNHDNGLKLSSFANNRYMIDFWKITSISKSKRGDLFISTLEAKDYPIFAVQFHPEKNLYEWKISADRTAEGIRISQIISNKFVDFARKNKNRFNDDGQFNKYAIYNFNTTTTNLSYLRIYPFKEPRPNDWPYSTTENTNKK